MPTIYWWHDDAFKAAWDHAAWTGKRTCVRAFSGMWRVSEVES